MKHVIKTTSNELDVVFLKELMLMHDHTHTQIDLILKDKSLSDREKIEDIRAAKNNLERSILHVKNTGGYFSTLVNAFVNGDDSIEESQLDILKRNNDGSITMSLENEKVDITVIIEGEDESKKKHRMMKQFDLIMKHLDHDLPVFYKNEPIKVLNVLSHSLVDVAYTKDLEKGNYEDQAFDDSYVFTIDVTTISDKQKTNDQEDVILTIVED